MFSKKTDNYGLPQWDYSDHPDFLNDMNPAYKTIDTELKKAVTASANAEQQTSVLTPIVTNHTTQIETAEHQIADLTTRMGNAEHNLITDGQDIDNLEAAQANTNLILAGYSATKTVSADVDGVKTRVSAIESGNVTTLSTEIDTGKVWIDGKKIYRKSVSLTLLSNAEPLTDDGSVEVIFSNGEFPYESIGDFVSSNVVGKVTYNTGSTEYPSVNFVNMYNPATNTAPTYLYFSLIKNDDLEHTALSISKDKAWGNDLTKYTIKLTIVGEYTKK